MLGKSRSGFLLRFVKGADQNWNLGEQEEYMQIRSPFQSVVGRSQVVAWFGLGVVGLFGWGPVVIILLISGNQLMTQQAGRTGGVIQSTAAAAEGARRQTGTFAGDGKEEYPNPEPGEIFVNREPTKETLNTRIPGQKMSITILLIFGIYPLHNSGLEVGLV